MARKSLQGLITRPIIENEANIQVSKTLEVPKHIERPDYIIDPLSGYGIYEGHSTVHPPDTIALLRHSGHIVSDTLCQVQAIQWQPNQTTEHIDQLVHNYIINTHNAYPTPIGFMGFPKSVCTSVNEVLCHGIPNNRPLCSGDIINVDVTAYKGGVHGDSSVMVTVGEVDERVMDLIQHTQQTLYHCIQQVQVGTPFSIIGEVCQQRAEAKGYFVSELFTGHGIGHKLHMPPMVHHVPNREKVLMEVGNVFTIEPIVVYQKPWQINWWSDGFTVTATSLPSAQWEHTIAITKERVEVLTQRPGEDITPK